MKNSFSLFEIIIAIVLISIITTYFLTKSKDLIDESVKVKVKSQIAIIRESIVKKNSSSILLGKIKLENLDDELANKSKVWLFSKILDIPLISSSLEEKKISNWIKVNNDSYRIYVSNELFLDFKFENDSFVCKSELNICKEFE